MTDDQLYNYCHNNKDDPDSNDGIRCVTYIQGFLDGAIATDEGVAENVISELSIEQIEQRKYDEYRKRVLNRIINFGPSYYAKFCSANQLKLKFW